MLTAFYYRPFSVKPANGILPVNESLQVTIEFTPTKAGDHQADLELCYDSGETILIDLYGGAQDSNVRLDKSSVRIENTYLGMAKQRTVILTNRTNVIAHFRWSEFATEELEALQRSRLVTLIQCLDKLGVALSHSTPTDYLCGLLPIELHWSGQLHITKTC